MAAEGAVMLGKTNMDEFAMGSSNETSFYGPVKNPGTPEQSWRFVRRRRRCLAARLASAPPAPTPAARPPAALNGVTGLKPTYGRVSRWGIAFASSLDQAGPLGLSAADCALMLQAMAGHDEKDSTCLNEPVDDYLGALDQSVDGLKIGVPKNFSPTIWTARSPITPARRCANWKNRRQTVNAVAAQHQTVGAGLLCDRAGGSQLQPVAL